MALRFIYSVSHINSLRTSECSQISLLLILGELALYGALRLINSTIPAALACTKENQKLILPASNSIEMTLIPEWEVMIAKHLLEVYGF
ncbi:hypothetical protein [Candidatus Williamhamiltonella defendens]|uniref:hypothetical protein n=1 Tax=Candidatus Williamhamiltonella defendens TaxID=138072 RepID=UPI00130E577E|nr:hypothetical protein [Candidatus Hamiltonella defensa]